MADEQAERNIKTYRDVYAAAMTGDWAKAESMLTEDFVVTEADTLPFAGVYHNLQYALAGFTTLFGRQEHPASTTQIKIAEIIGMPF